MTTLKQFDIVINENFFYVQGYESQGIATTLAYSTVKNNLICHEHYKMLWEGIEFGISDSHYSWRLSWDISKKPLEAMINRIVVEIV